MRKAPIFCAFVAILSAGPAWAAGAKKEEPVAPVAASNEQLATEYFNRGLEHRDSAWKLEQRAAGKKKPEKLLAKADAHWEKAVVAFLEAVSNNPQMYQAHGSLGYAYRKLGRYEESLEAYDRSLEITPRYVEAIEYRGEAYLGLDRLDDAKQAYLELFRLDRGQAETLLAAMREWIDTRGDSGEVPVGIVRDFSTWVDERAEIAGQTAKSTAAQGRSW